MRMLLGDEFGWLFSQFCVVSSSSDVFMDWQMDTGRGVVRFSAEGTHESVEVERA